MDAIEPLVPLCERDQLDSADRAVYDHVAEARGSMGNVFKALANAPNVLGSLASVGETLRFHGRLPDDLREAVVLTVARERGCIYEWTHHWHVAVHQGMAPDLLEHLRSRDAEAAPAPLGPALRLARILASSPDRAPRQLVRELRAELGADGIVELTTLIGYYRLLADAIEHLGVPLEAGVKAVPMPAAPSGPDGAGSA